MQEIEKKYLVKYLIDDIQNYEKVHIEQGYLNFSSNPIIRVRKWNDKYFLTYKGKTDNKDKNLNVMEEYELPISKECYDNLSKKIENNMIVKDRYLIPLDNDLTAELDIYHGKLEGLMTVEVEFSDKEEYHRFTEPDWFSNDVTGVKKYLNSWLSTINNIDEL